MVSLIMSLLVPLLGILVLVLLMEGLIRELSFNAVFSGRSRGEGGVCWFMG